MSRPLSRDLRAEAHRGVDEFVHNRFRRAHAVVSEQRS